MRREQLEKALKYHLVRSSWGKEVSHQARGVGGMFGFYFFFFKLKTSTTFFFFGVRHKLGMKFVSLRPCDVL